MDASHIDTLDMLTTEQAISAMQAAPSPLPTLAEVQRFGKHWFDQIKKIDASANVGFSVYMGNLGTTFYAYSNAASAEGPTPEQALQSLEGKTGPGARMAKIAKLEAEITALKNEGREP